MKYKNTGKKMRGMKTLCGVTAAIMIFASAAGAFGASQAYAAQKMTKEETVYVITDSEGEQKETIVSDHLYNADSLDTITDISSLKDIENVKGDETFKKGSGDQIIWQADGSDIYYQGSTDESAPIDMNIEYYLDGKKVSADQLSGKSGKVSIKIKYENNCTVEVDGSSVKVPFVVMTGFIIEDNCFRNVSVTSGKVIDDGEKEIVAVMAVPGLAENLGISSDELGFSDEVEITGTAENFSLEDMMTVVTSNIFEDVDTGKLSELDMDGQIEQLDSAANKLAQGASALYEGVHQLNEKAPELSSGVSKLNDGAKQLDSGTAQMLDGSRALAGGNAQLSAALEENLGTMKAGAENLYSGSSQVYEGILSLQAAINGTSESVGLMQAAGSVADGLASLKDGVNSASAGSIRYLNSALQTLQALRDAEEDESKQQTYDTLIGYIQNSIGIQQNIAVPEELVAGANGVYGGLSQISASIAGSGTSENPGLAAGAKSIRDGIGQLDSGLDAATADSGSLTSSARELAAGAAQLSEGQTAVSSGAKELAAGMESLENASGQLIGGIGQLDKGAVELSTGMKQFYSQGIQKLVQLYNSDLKGITENVDSVIKAGKQYKSFTQLPESMDGNVKFIYKTEITE